MQRDEVGLAKQILQVHPACSRPVAAALGACLQVGVVKAHGVVRTTLSWGQAAPSSSSSLRSVSSVPADSKDREPRKRSGYCARREREKTMALCLTVTTGMARKPDIAYEAVAHLTVLAGSGTRSRRGSTVKTEITMSAPR